MATWPHQETLLTEYEKKAYRHLLYWAMVDIRIRCPAWGRESLNPLEWRRQYRQSRIAGAVADCLHNLGFFAYQDFRNFNADMFWQDYERLSRRFADTNSYHMPNYRHHYDDQLARLQNEPDI